MITDIGRPATTRAIVTGTGSQPRWRRRVRSRQGATRGSWVRRTLLTTLTWVLTVIFFFPVFWMVVTGFKTEAQAVSLPPQIFFMPTLEQYQNIVDRGILPYLQNSLLAAGVSTALVLLLALPAAYALAIRPIPKSRDALFFFLSTRFLPVAGVIAAIYLLARQLDLLNNVLVLILLYTAMNLPIAIWMLRSFMAEIPAAILEAARVDGAGFTTMMLRIIVPLLAPGIGATALICVIFAWNEFFLALILTTTSQSATLPVFLTGFITSQGAFWAQLDAAATVCAVPVVIAGWVAQKQLVRGLSLGAVK